MGERGGVGKGGEERGGEGRGGGEGRRRGEGRGEKSEGLDLHGKQLSMMRYKN